MPRMRRRYRRRRPKRRGRGRRRKYVGRLRPNYLNTNTGIVPSRQIVKLRYVEDIKIDTTVADFLTFSANSIFMPQDGISTHQPYGHDTLATMYRHYTVLGAKITIQFINDDTTDPIFALIDLQDTNASTTAATTVREAGRCAYGVLTSSPDGKLWLSKNFSAKRFFNKVDVVDNSQLGASFGLNPAERAFWHVNIGGIDPAVLDVIVFAVVTIDYIVALSEPQTLAGS